MKKLPKISIIIPVYNEEKVIENLLDSLMKIKYPKKREIDLFVATWSLSETSKNMQNYFKKLNYFNAKYLLFAYQKNNQMFKYAENIKLLPNSYESIYNSETRYIKDNFYLFAKKKNYCK